MSIDMQNTLIAIREIFDLYQQFLNALKNDLHYIIR